MTHLSITINNHVEFDGELGDWVSKPPTFIKNIIKPGQARPEGHWLAIMAATTDAVTKNQATAISVNTWPDGWAMTSKKIKVGKQK